MSSAPGPHLGDRVSALVDGALPGDARDRALAHLAGCASCRAAAEAERLTAARLRALSAPAPSDALVARLLAMGDPGGPVRPAGPDVPGATRPRPVPAPGRVPRVAAGGTSHPRGRGARGVRRPRARALAAGVVSLGVVGLLAGATLGAVDQSPSGRFVPPVDQFTREHARTGQQIPFGEARFAGTGRASVDPAGLTSVTSGPGSPTPSRSGR